MKKLNFSEHSDTSWGESIFQIYFAYFYNKPFELLKEILYLIPVRILFITGCLIFCLTRTSSAQDTLLESRVGQPIDLRKDSLKDRNSPAPGVQQDSLPNRRPKIGLTLSGGGAKGLAHIGILKAIDSAGLSIDYITGTSMGSIIGSLYASGYSGGLHFIYCQTNALGPDSVEPEFPAKYYYGGKRMSTANMISNYPGKIIFSGSLPVCWKARNYG